MRAHIVVRLPVIWIKKTCQLAVGHERETRANGAGGEIDLETD